jgi:hypothetical protein
MKKYYESLTALTLAFLGSVHLQAFGIIVPNSQGLILWLGQWKNGLVAIWKIQTNIKVPKVQVSQFVQNSFCKHHKAQEKQCKIYNNNNNT